jgi:hypothetical protein
MYPHELVNKNIYIKINSRHDMRFEQATSKVQRTFFIYSTLHDAVEPNIMNSMGRNPFPEHLKQGIKIF